MATMNTAQKKYTTIDEIEKDPLGSVWVLNTTERSGEAGNLIWSVPKLNGNGSDPVRIRKSFIPFDLTLQVSKAQLLASSEFRNTVRKGLVRICSPAYAKALLSSEEGKEEQRRVDNLLRASMMALDNMNVTNADEDDEDETFDPKEVQSGKKSKRQVALAEEIQKKEVLKQAPSVHIKVQNIVANASNENWTAVQIKVALRNYGKLTAEDLRFLAVSFKDKPKVMEFLREKRDALKAKAKAAA